jgi:DNA (cytosine-5)-methyltransferase 1
LNEDSIWVRGTLPGITRHFGRSIGVSPFRKAGVMWRREVWTRDVVPDYGGPFETLGDNLLEDGQVPEAFFVPPERVDDWKKLKGAKREPRTAANGHSYFYSEGAVAFPDPTDQPSRTILTGEGGGSPSRFKHVVQAKDGRLRRLAPVELEQLNGFPAGWTEGMPDGRRAFMMGNALVVGLVAQVGAALSRSPATSHQPGSELATVASA